MRWLWQCVRAALKPTAPARRSPAPRLEPLEDRLLLAGRFGTPNVVYHGGPLLPNVQVQAVYYGQPWTTSAALQQTVTQTDNFLRYLTTSPYFDALQQYNVGHGTFLSHEIVAQNPANQTIDDTQIQQILNAEIAAGHLAAPGANSLYVFFTAPSVVVTANGQDSVHDFAAYHSADTGPGGAAVYYAVIPYPSGNVASVQLTDFQQETIALSHEVAEGVTDPDTRTGWFSGRSNEIADLAQGRFGSLNGYDVQGFWSQADGRVVIPSSPGGSSLQATATRFAAGAGRPVTAVVAALASADPNATAGTFTTAIDWGDGTSSDGTVVVDPKGGFDVVGTHTYAATARPGSYTVNVTAFDTADNSTAAAASAATVTTAPLRLTAAAPNLQTRAGSAFSGTVATFADTDGSGARSFTATIAWGDGATSTGTVTADPAGGFDLGGSHTYAATGVYMVFVSVRDADGDSAAALGSGAALDGTAFSAAASGILQSAEYSRDLIVKDYRQYLGRTPTDPEVAYWTVVRQGGATDAQVAAGFLSSPEFYRDAGNNDKAWVDALYRDLLGRGARAGEDAYWLQALAGGMSRTDVALGFLTSQERDALAVRGYYQQYLGRAATDAEVAYWIGRMQTGATDAQAVAGFLGSTEYYNRAGGNDLRWVDALYRDLLGRGARSDEEAYWLQALAAPIL
jgi:hypothetical protein